jgi:hypothetical protein
MSKKVFVNLPGTITYKGIDYIAGPSVEMPEDVAKLVINRELGTLVDAPAAAPEVKENAGSNAIGDDGYPGDFPGRKTLVKLGKTYDEVKGMSRDDLIKLNGIAEKTADDILAYGKE